MDTSTGGTSSSTSAASSSSGVDRLKLLYPFVNEEETPLPRCWSSKDKYNFIGLSQNNLRVHYKGKEIELFHKTKLHLHTVLIKCLTQFVTNKKLCHSLFQVMEKHIKMLQVLEPHIPFHLPVGFIILKLRLLAKEEMGKFHSMFFKETFLQNNKLFFKLVYPTIQLHGYWPLSARC